MDRRNYCVELPPNQLTEIAIHSITLGICNAVDLHYRYGIEGCASPHLAKFGEGNTAIFKINAGDCHSDSGRLGTPTVEIKIGPFDLVHIPPCSASFGGSSGSGTNSF